MLLRLSDGQNGGDCMEEFDMLSEFFILLFDVVRQSLHSDLFMYMIIALTCYGIICLFWSLVLDD